MNLKHTTEDYRKVATITSNFDEGRKRRAAIPDRKGEQRTGMSERNAVDSPTNCKIAVEPHITNDI